MIPTTVSCCLLNKKKKKKVIYLELDGYGGRKYDWLKNGANV